MKSIYIKIAGLFVELVCRHDEYIKFLCQSFLLPKKPINIDISIQVEDEELIKMNDVPGGFIVPEGNREFYKLHKLLRKEILAYDCLIMHGTAIKVDDYGLVFTADTGTGKSTLADLWKEVLGPRVSYINDDWPLIRICNNKVYLESTPWCGYRRLYGGDSVPLKAVIFIERSTIVHVQDVDKNLVITELLKRACTLYQSLSNEDKLYKLFEKIINIVSFKKAKFTLGSESVYKLLSSIEL